MTKPDKFRYYWCVNCGHHGDYGFERQRNLNCEKCKYEDIIDLDQQEYIEYKAQKGEKVDVKEAIENN